MTHNPDNSYSKVGIPSSAKGGFVQQTFLGASIVDFNINAGFGEETSTISANLIPDEFNSGDAMAIGRGDDVYHDGKDKFRPPPVGAQYFLNLVMILQPFPKHFVKLMMIYIRR